MDWFHREVTAIENEARHFIDDSFKTLRSAEGAFDMLLNFRHIRSREAINSQMMKKFNDILVQFWKRGMSYDAYYNIPAACTPNSWPFLFKINCLPNLDLTSVLLACLPAGTLISSVSYTVCIYPDYFQFSKN